MVSFFVALSHFKLPLFYTNTISVELDNRNIAWFIDVLENRVFSFIWFGAHCIVAVLFLSLVIALFIFDFFDSSYLLSWSIRTFTTSFQILPTLSLLVPVVVSECICL